MNLATEINLKPSARTVLNHLRKRGSISPTEALVTYGLSRLAAAVYTLRQAGYEIRTQRHEDEMGHPYARYLLSASTH